MDPSPRRDEANDDDGVLPALPKVPLAIVTGAVGAVIGGWLMSFCAGIFFYIPLIPGAVVGYAICRVCNTDRIIVRVIAAIFGFTGMVFGDALTFDLVSRPGTWNYITHFWEAANATKVLFWILNAGVGYWFARSVPISAASGLPVTTPGASCPHCGEGNLPNSQFCAQCGQPMN
jgi:hypothetical protein